MIYYEDIFVKIHYRRNLHSYNIPEKKADVTKKNLITIAAKQHW